MTVKSNVVRVVEKKQMKIGKAVNKKFTPTQPVDPPFLNEMGAGGLVSFVKLIGGVLMIIPALIKGILEGMSQGLLRGLQTATTTYERQLNEFRKPAKIKPMARKKAQAIKASTKE